MCFAPRYMSGPIALPWSPCRNTASLPETPCASTTPEQIPTNRAVTISPTKLCLIRIVTPRSFAMSTACSVALILFMAAVARRVDRLPSGEERILVLRLGCPEGHDPGVPECSRPLHPVSRVNDTVSHQQQVSGLDESSGAIPDDLPFLIGLRGL